ncbi:hypothetical protein [Geodermatophilus sp. SYSU D00710]
MGTQGDIDGAEQQRPALPALSDWPQAADAGVDPVIVSTERVAVDLFVDGDYEYVVLFWENEPGQWEEAGSSSGHVDRAHVDAQA